MSVMRQVRVKINAKGIAKGILAMMRERHAASGDAEDDETIIRFGMLPKRWMDILETQMTDVICEKFLVNNYEKRTGEVTTIIRHEDGDHSVETFKIKDLVSEMVHEVSLAMYGEVEMLV